MLLKRHGKKIPERHSLKEEEFALAHSFRGFGSWLFGSMHLSQRMTDVTEDICSSRVDKSRGKLPIKNSCQSHAPRSLLPPTRLNSIQFPEYPNNKIAQATGNQPFNT